MSKHNLEVVLAAISPNLLQPGQSRVLLITREDGLLELPSQPLGDSESTIQVAADLLTRHTGLKARILGVGWVDLVPCPLADSVERLREQERVIAVPYAAMLPGEVVRLSQPRARWVTIGELLGGELTYLDHMDIISVACRRV
jgi:hypothetical protein